MTSLQDIPFEYNEINEIFKFSLTAYQKTGEENLSFLYLMKVVMLLTKARGDCDIIFENVSNYKLILTKLSVYFEKNHKPSQDQLVSEIVLYQVDYFKLLMLHQKLHEFLV